MSNDDLLRNINILINEKPKMLVKLAINQVKDHIFDAIHLEKFYDIDYDKYAQQIIDDSKLPDNKKNEVRKKFPNFAGETTANIDNDNSSIENHSTENNQSPNSVQIKADMYLNPEKYKTAAEVKLNPLDTFQTSNPNLVNSNSNIYNDLIKNPIVWQKNINCIKCEQPTDENDRVYYSGYPYHKHCVKCMNCEKVFDSTCKLQDFVCITKGLFLCRQHYNDYQSSQQLSVANSDEYHKQNKKNFVKEIFDSPLLSTEIINNMQGEDDFITPNIIEDSIPINLPYDNFIPTVTLKFDLLPSEIDFSELEDLLGDEIVILGVEKGCTLLKIAFLQIKKLGKKAIDKVKNFVSDIKTKLKSTVGKSVIGNLVDEPLINVPDNQKIQEEYNKPSLNLLQNTYELNEIELEDIKEEVLSNLHKEKTKKNWKFLFNHEDIFKQVEKQIREDIINNEFEMIIVAQTVIANRNIEKFETIKNNIPASRRKVAYLYHGTKLDYHQSIVKEHFKMPGQDEMTHFLDSGFYGKGIYSTENLFYASMYANGYCFLNFNQKTHVFCCLSVYDTMNVGECLDMSHSGKKIGPAITSSYGINHAIVGSSTGFTPIKATDKEKNYLSAEEFVFPNKYQIIPVYSFTVMRKDHFILWKDDNIDNSENSNYFKDLSKKMEVNVYSKNSVNDALNLIRKKKKNMFKLITNAGKDLNGKDLIIEARKIIGSNFVCLVFASNIGHYQWIKEMENVLFTVAPSDFKRFCELNLNEKEVLEFVSSLEDHFGFQFKINKNDLLRFPTASKSYYTG
ncbi:hypothetical protein M9Y10_019062 [Tritrichomonas musculus]|uniref:LIM zinc-binding domain-containing protein n=1 Tax=Tritrichomonas musculus TaxID=1915356 RepID=A0ABR2HJF7_9EUKA